MGTTSSAPATDNEFDAEALKDWIVQRSKPLSIAGGVIVVAVAGYLFWEQSARIKNERAETALMGAQGAYYQGNTALAKSDLEKVVSRYPGTAGATQATMLLAAISYGEGKYDDGIKALTAALGSAEAHFSPGIEEMIGSGLIDAKKFDEAATHYLKAADRTPFAADKDIYKSEAARAYGAGGKTVDARKIWTELAANRESPVLNEAKVRIGELDAKAASK